MVECDLAKVEVAGSNPVSRSILRSPDLRAGFGWQATLRAKVDQFIAHDAPDRPPPTLLSLRLDAAGFPCTKTASPTGAVAKW